MGKIECFKIQLLRGEEGQSVFDLSQSQNLCCIDCDKNCEHIRPYIIYADPFLFVKDDYLYLFYERKKLYEPGLLVMQRTNDLLNWSTPVTVLSEPYHLSYPYVFENEGEIYMIPETCASESIRLYKADNKDLNHFSFSKTLIKRTKNDSSIVDDYSDSSIYFKNGIYYLITTVNYNGINHLELYFSKNLEGPYKNHPSSPLVCSQKYGRNGGSFIESNGKLYRVAQDCEYKYGDDVHLFEIDTITENEYKEHLVKESLLKGTTSFYKKGGHQFNVVSYKGVTIIATDAKEYNTYLIPRILKKLHIK